MAAPLDHSGQRLDDADFTGARLHAPVFERARLTDAILVDADIDGDITGLRLNGVEVEPLVRAERERMNPELVALRASDPAGVASAWAMVQRGWSETVARARALPGATLDERVDGEWSFIETLRHLILATDFWHRRMILGEPAPSHPWGLAGSFLDPASLGLDYAARPSLDEVLAVREGRVAGVSATVASLTEAELARVCVPPPTPGHPTEPHTVLECLHVVLTEEYEHRRYATRDLDLLESGPAR